MTRHQPSSVLVLFALVLTLAAAPAQAQAEDPVASDRKTYEKIGRFDAGQLKREQDTIRVEGNSFVDETGKTYPAKVTAINARVDAVAQTVELEARIDGRPSELLAGMTGIARFPQ